MDCDICKQKHEYCHLRTEKPIGIDNISQYCVFLKYKFHLPYHVDLDSIDIQDFFGHYAIVLTSVGEGTSCNFENDEDAMAFKLRWI